MHAVMFTKWAARKFARYMYNMPAYIIAKSLHVHTVQYTTAPTSFPDSACISLGMRLQLYMFDYAGRQAGVCW